MADGPAAHVVASAEICTRRDVGCCGGARPLVSPPSSGRERDMSLKKSKRVGPIAAKIIKKMKKKRGKVIDLAEVAAGRAYAEELQKTVATPEALRGFHPAHAAYVHAQNQLSVLSEQLSMLPEAERFTKVIVRAEDEYMPGGPPMSPLTTSFFTCWALFDVCVGLAKETLATTIHAAGKAFGMNDELLHLTGLMQQSRMGIYVHEGIEGDLIVLRDLVTDDVCRAIVPSGYVGHRGELWYVRVLAPPRPGGAEHVVFTTPYVLLRANEAQWQAYFRRTLPDAPHAERIDRYEHHMKYGPTRQYWPEFVLDAYVNHRTEVIYLAGLPDVPESLPHSRTKM